MNRGIYLLKISFILFCLVFTNCNSIMNIKKNSPMKSIYFFNIKDQVIRIRLNETSINKCDISIQEPNTFFVKSLTEKKKYTEIILESNSTDRYAPDLLLTYKNNLNNQIRIKLFFYSQKINIDSLTSKSNIEYRIMNDKVPPFFFSTSLQVGDYIICKDDQIISRFSSLKDLYFISFTLKAGKYSISEVDCEGAYFGYTIN